MKRKVLNIILVLLSMLTIFLFSSENADNSSKTSRGVVEEVAKIIVNNDEVKLKKLEPTIELSIGVVRKIAHFSEFFVLGFLLINLIKDYRKLNNKYIIMGIILCILYACSDEIHQLFVSGRAARILDIGIDSLGSSLGILLYYTIYKKYHYKKVVDNK